jgi:hypothetical protein
VTDPAPPSDPYDILSGNWPPEQATAYSTAAQSSRANATEYRRAADVARTEANRAAGEWQGQSGERYARDLLADADRFAQHARTADAHAQHLDAAAGEITAAKAQIAKHVDTFTYLASAAEAAQRTGASHFPDETPEKYINLGREAVAAKATALDGMLENIGGLLNAAPDTAPAQQVPATAPAPTFIRDTGQQIVAETHAEEVTRPAESTALPWGQAVPADTPLPEPVVVDTPTDTAAPDTPAPGTIPPSLGQMPASMPATQTAPAAPAPAPAAPAAVPTAPAPAAMPSAPINTGTGTGTGSGASSSPAPAPAPAADAPALATASTPASSALTPALPLTLTPLTPNPAPFPAPGLPAIPTPAASTELSAAPTPAQTRTPGSPAAASLFQAQQAPAPAPAMPVMPPVPATPMPTAAAPVAPAPTPMPAPAPAPAPSTTTAAAPAPAPASTAGDAVRRDSASVTAAAAGLIAPGGTAEAPEPSYAAALPAAEALAHRTLATIRRSFVQAGWVTPIAVAVLAGDHGHRCVFSTADDVSIIPAGASLPVGCTPLDRVPGLDSEADRLRGMSSPSEKLRALLSGFAVIVSTAVSDADGEQVQHQSEVEAGEIASAGELLPTTPGRAVWARTRPEDAAAEVLRLSLHAGDDPLDATTAKVRLWAARWENTPPTDYLGLVTRWLLSDAAECVRLNKRLSDAAYCVDQLRELTAGPRAA